MKIVCESCGAKYSIADEKVAGKVFKIRCKRCSEVIVVRGDQQQPEEDATRVYDQAVDAVWHVVVNGEQQGPFSPPQIGEMLTNSQIDWEAYVWREGFDNWLPARDVPELVEAVTGQNAGGYEEAPVEAYEPPAPVAAAAPVRAATPSRSMGADPFADDGGGADPGLFGGGGGGGGGDLFSGGGAAAANPFGGGHDDGVVASAPNPRVHSAQAMTGARNENSVLFSLKNLQALATGGNEGSAGPSAASPSPRAGFATGEGSGLIDIRALASATGLGSDSSQRGDKDELLSMGGGQTGAFSSLGSPMLAPPLAAAAEETKSKNTLLYVGFGVLALAVIGMGGGMFYLATREPQVVQVPAAPVVAAAAAAAPVAAETAKPPAEEQTEGEKAAAKAAAEAEEKADDSREGSGSSKRRRSSGGGASSGGSEPAAASSGSDRGGEDSEPAAPTKASKNTNATIDDLLGGALGGGGAATKTKAAPAAAPASNLPENPSRDDVMNALRSVDDAVKACGGGQHGVAMAAITVAGNTGRVSSVNVSGQFQGTPVGSCVARAVRAAKFPKFSRPDFKVNFPFRI